MHPTTKLRNRGVGVVLAVGVLAYVLITGSLYYDGFFRFWSHGVRVRPTALALPVGQRWNLVPWTRFPITLATAALMAWCAAAFWRGRATARLLSFFTFVGLLLPQIGFLLSYLIGIRRVPVPVALAVGLATIGVPTAVLGHPRMALRFEVHEAGLGWERLHVGRRRLLLTVIAASWMGFGIEFYLGMTAMLPATLGTGAGVLGFVSAALAVVGLLRLRTWALLAALLSSVLTSVVLVDAHRIWEDFGYLATASAATRWGLRYAFVVPPVVLASLTWPFLRALASRLRDASPADPSDR